MGKEAGPNSLEELAGQRFVVKLGGEIMLHTGGLDALCADIAGLSRSGVGMVVVHGGGPQADALAARLGHTVRKAGGRRITDDDALEVAKMVYGGSANLELLGTLKRHGARGVGLSGVDANLITVRRRPRVKVRDARTGEEEWVDYGHVGDVESVDISLLDILLSNGFVPVIASLAADASGNLYNINADTVASTVAIALRAERLVLATNVPGILRDPTDPASLIPSASIEEVGILVEAGVVSGGMLPKVENALAALRGGVGLVQMIDGRATPSLLLPALLGVGVGTRIGEGG